MRSVWSFWSNPYAMGVGPHWLEEKYHLFAWALSVLTARQYYPPTTLITDTVGKDVLVDRLGLPFDEVSTALDALAEQPLHFWVLGRLYAYQSMVEPFIHLNPDVFVWQELSPDVTDAHVFAQNPEEIELGGNGYYRPDDLDRALNLLNGWRPAAWDWALNNRVNIAVNCGVFGGSDTEFIQRFATDAIRFIEDPANAAAWQLLGDMTGDNIVLEQYMLGAYLAYYEEEGRDTDPLMVRYLFGSIDEAFDDAAASNVGYTRLIGEGKTNPDILAQLETRLQNDYPEVYESCLLLLDTWEGW